MPSSVHDHWNIRRYLSIQPSKFNSDGYHMQVVNAYSRSQRYGRGRFIKYHVMKHLEHPVVVEMRLFLQTKVHSVMRSSTVDVTVRACRQHWEL